MLCFQGIPPLGTLACKIFHIYFQINIIPCELVHNFKTVLRKKNFCVKDKMSCVIKETEAKSYLTHIGMKVI